MRAHAVRLMHDNGIRAEIQFNKYIYHTAGTNVYTNFSQNKSVLLQHLEDLGNIYNK